ncbi:MAG: NUDIX domain-containing protein [Pseudomonadota bacterium]
MLTGAKPDAARALKIIASYTPVDVVSTHYKQQFTDFITQHPDHFGNRYNYLLGMHGHLTAQAFVYHPGHNAIALLHHKKLNMWLGQGGHMEPEDGDFLATALREAFEEAGFTRLRLLQDAPIDLDAHGFPARGDQPDHLHYDVRYLFETDDDTLTLDPTEGTNLEWVPCAEFRTRMGESFSNSRTIRAIESRFCL